MEQNQHDNLEEQAIKGLLSESKTSVWKDWLFDVQNFFVENGFYEGATFEERTEYASKFASLKYFFKNVEHLEISRGTNKDFYEKVADRLSSI